MVALVPTGEVAATVPSAGAMIMGAITSSSATLGMNIGTRISLFSMGVSSGLQSASTKVAMSTQTATQKLIFQDKIKEMAKKAEDANKTKNWFMKFLDGKGKWMKDFAQRAMQFAKFMAVIARFWPIIKVFIAVIIIFGNLLFYVIMIIAWIGASILEVIYFIISLPPFIYILWFIFFLISDGIPFILYSIVFLGLLGFILVFCILMVAADLFTGGHLKNLILCQNSPTGWYKNPSHHLTNSFSRGLFCSRPCKKNYYPDETGTSCLKLPKNSPSFCPQAQIMRFYTGDGKKDGKYIYGKVKTKGNMQYLSKSPNKREDSILENYMNKKKFMEDCNNPDNPMSMKSYDPLTLNICANIESMANSNITRFDPKIIPKLSKVCGQGFCDSKSTYPFCTKLNKVSDTGSADLIKKIILAIIAMITFTMTLIFVFTYANET